MSKNVASDGWWNHEFEVHSILGAKSAIFYPNLMTLVVSQFKCSLSFTIINVFTKIAFARTFASEKLLTSDLINDPCRKLPNH